MNAAPEDRLLGEYRLKELVSENAFSRTWLAEQVSVSRRVLVDELRADRADQREIFLANVRAKAAVEHPLVSSVYEAVANESCFFAHELLPGITLESHRTTSEPFKPGQFAHLLRRISEAQIQYETLGLATSPIGLENIYLDGQGVLRLDNLAIAGPRTPELSTRDINELGNSLLPLMADGQPGATRALTLLGWMRDEGIDAPLTWTQVRDYCNQIELQLTEPAPEPSPTKTRHYPRKKPAIAAIAIASGIALIAILALALKMRPKTPPRPPRPVLPDSVLIPGGIHPTHDGTHEELHSFRISPHEVTIDQYSKFIETLETLAKDQRDRTFDHEDQPQEKTSHLPDDWAALLAAARNNGHWNGLPVTLDSPIVGIDWWDCAAYAEWKHARLPSQEEWFAALRKDVEVASTIKPSKWIPIGSETADRTPQGLMNMAGSVSEWTRRPASNPVNPLGPRKWVIIGGSYLKPGSNALTREWIDDRSLRRPDLGFRVAFDVD